MVDDLKQQASELYRERAESDELPTSDSLSMKKVFYVTIVVAALVLLAIQLFGGFSRPKDAVVAANTPPPLVKEAPTPEMLEPAPPAGLVQATAPQSAPPQQALPQTAQPKTEPAPAAPPQVQPAPSQTSAPRKAAPPAAAERPKEQTGATGQRRPVLTRDTEPVPARRKTPAVSPSKPAPEVAAQAPEPPKLSDIEVARRELAREIVMEKNPALTQLVTATNSKGWSAQPEGTDEYLVTFNIVDEGTGAPAQYVWRVNVSTRSTMPLSYYARRLS